MERRLLWSFAITALLLGLGSFCAPSVGLRVQTGVSCVLALAGLCTGVVGGILWYRAEGIPLFLIGMGAAVVGVLASGNTLPLVDVGLAFIVLGLVYSWMASRIYEEIGA